MGRGSSKNALPSFQSHPGLDESPSSGQPPSGQKDLKRNLVLALGALGVVYGDIGTSPLYTVKECFHGLHAIALTHGNLLPCPTRWSCGPWSPPTPRMPRRKRLNITNLGRGFHRVIATYGFRQTPNVLEILELASQQGLELDISATTFYVGRERSSAPVPPRWPTGARNLFGFLTRNSWNLHVLQHPPNRVVELGSQVEL